MKEMIGGFVIGAYVLCFLNMMSLNEIKRDIKKVLMANNEVICEALELDEKIEELTINVD